MDLSDEKLMQLLVENDLSAFEILYSRHFGRLFSYFNNRQPHKAQDLLQETFIRLLERREQWKGQPFLPWFFVMARNLMLDEIRRENRALQDFEKYDKMDISDWLEGLKDDEKNLISQRYFAGKSFSELSRDYATSEVSLRQKMSRLLKVIRRGFNE